jgi:hypothetical protein
MAGLRLQIFALRLENWRLKSRLRIKEKNEQAKNN